MTIKYMLNACQIRVNGMMVACVRLGSDDFYPLTGDDLVEFRDLSIKYVLNTCQPATIS